MDEMELMDICDDVRDSTSTSTTSEMESGSEITPSGWEDSMLRLSSLIACISDVGLVVGRA